jgi:hypothetical protein
MAADYSAYDAGTAYLTIEARLDDDFEAKIAAALQGIPAHQLTITPNMDGFVKDLDDAWKDLDHTLSVKVVADQQSLEELSKPIELIAVLNTDVAQADYERFRDALPPIELIAVLDTEAAAADLAEFRERAAAEPVTVHVATDEAQAQLDTKPAEQALTEFFSRTPIFTIPLVLDTTVADAQLDELRAKAAEPVTMKVNVTESGSDTGGGTRRRGTRTRKGEEAEEPSIYQREPVDLDAYMASRSAAQTDQAQAAQRILYGAAEQNPQLAAQEIMGAASQTSPQVARQIVSGAHMRGGPWPAPSAFGQTERPTDWSRWNFGENTEPASMPGEGLANFTKFLQSVEKGGIGGGAKGLPSLVGSKDWAGLLSDAGMMGGPEAGAAAAALGALKGVLSDLVGPVTDAISVLTEVTTAFMKFSLMGGGLSLGGALLGDLGAIGITGAFGLKNVPAAMQAGTALREWQRDPNAQLQQQSAVLSAQMGERTAGEGVQSAIWNQGDALFQAKAATEQLTMAQESAVLSQRALNDAYKDAGRSVRDMNDALEDAKLKQEGAALSVSAARTRLLQTQMDPSATLLDKQLALHEYNVAQQGYKESKNKTADQTVDTAISNQRGVQQNTQVLQAVRGMQSATLGVEEAAHAQVDAQHQIVQATWGIENSLTQVALAANQMKIALNPEPVDQYHLALDKLSPSARDFVEQMQAMYPELKKVQNAISDQLFDHLADSIRKFLNDQGISITSAMTGIAHAINGGLKDTLQGLDDLFTKLQRDGTWDKFVTGAENLAKGMAPIITGLTDLFIQLGAKTSGSVGPLMTQIGQSLQTLAPALGDLANAFAKGLTDALPSLTTMIQKLAEAAVPVMPEISHLFQVFANILSDIGPDLGQMVGALLSDVASFLEGLEKSGGLKQLVDQMRDMFHQIGPLMGPLGEMVGHLLPALFDVITLGIPWLMKMAPEFEKWFHEAQPLVEAAGHLADLLPAIMGAIDDLSHPLQSITDLFSDWTGWVERIVDGLGKIADHMGNLGGILGGSSGDNSGGGGWGSKIGKFFNPLSFVPTRAQGGPIAGEGSSISDSIPAMLSDGEYVINARAAAAHRPLLDAINGYALGGIVKGVAYANDIRGGHFGRLFRRVVEHNVLHFASGGPVNARDWGAGHPNIPYIEGGTAADGVDCSGYVGLLQQISMGVANPTARLGVTGDVVGGTWPQFVSGADPSDAFIIGANAEHMAAAILGTNFEARQPGENVRIGGNAASPFDGQFTTVGHVDPNAFQPAYDATGNSGGQDPSTAGGDTDALANETMLPQKAPTRFSEWAGNTTTNVITSLLNYGTPTPPMDGSVVPMQGFQDAFDAIIKTAPSKRQHDQAATFLLGVPLPDQNAPGAGTPSATPPAPNADASTGGSAGVSTPDNPDAGTKDAPDMLGTDKLAGGEGVGGVLGALEVGAGGFAKAAGEFVSGQISSALNVLGGGSELDTVPGWMQAAYQVWAAEQTKPKDSKKRDTVIGKDYNAPKASTSGSTPGSIPRVGGGTPSIPRTANTPSRTNPDRGSPNELNEMATDNSGASSSGGGDQLNKMAGQGTAAGGLPPLITYTPGGGVSQWTSTFAAVLSSLGMPSSWLSLGMAQMETEDASGDPYAINNWDSNAAKGTPSKGLMQVIDPTFNSMYPKFSSLGYPANIYDPRSNIAAGLEWEVYKRGTPVGDWGQGHGYATGGDVSGDGSSIGDVIPALLSDGEFVVNARSADANRSLLHAINADAGAVSRLALKQMIPTKGLVGVGAGRGGVDQSATYNIHAHDVEQGFRKAALYHQQRAATYTSRWR